MLLEKIEKFYYLRNVIDFDGCDLAAFASLDVLNVFRCIP